MKRVRSNDLSAIRMKFIYKDELELTPADELWGILNPHTFEEDKNCEGWEEYVNGLKKEIISED